MSYTVRNDGMIPNPKTQTVNYGGRQFIVIHSTADLNATAGNIDQYFDGNWSSVYAFVQWAIDDKEAWQNYDNGFRSWGAGNVNGYAWSQIEICEFQDNNRSKAAIANAIQLTKALVKEATAKGVKVQIISHKEAAEMFGGSDHVDPIPYFNRFGYTMDWFRQQVGAANGGSTQPVNSTPTSSNGFKVEPWNKVQSVDVDGLNIRTSQTAASSSIGTLRKGQTFNATSICRNGQPVKVGNNTYSTWFEVNGRGWVSGAYVTEVGGGYRPNLAIDGYMGPDTIRAMQRILGTTVDGVISRPSNMVRALQNFLNKKGYGLAVDGSMGPATIKALQKYLGTTPDGVISRPSNMVRALQTRLNTGSL